MEETTRGVWRGGGCGREKVYKGRRKEEKRGKHANQPAEYEGAELEGRFGGLWEGGVWKIGKRGCSGKTETKNGAEKPK